MGRVFMALFVNLFLIASSAFAQTTARPGLPPRDNAAPQTGTARLRGRVLAADTGSPLRRAQVLIFAGDVGVRRSTTTDADGRYEFGELPASRYTVSASKGGFVTLQFGQRRPFEPGTAVTLADAQTATNIDVSLPRGAVITGRVTDEFGEPLTMAQVQAQRYAYTPGGKRQLSYAGGGNMTDDLGQFRIFGLMPGEYIVSAQLRTAGMAAVGPGSTSDTSESYPPTYYSGTANPAEAQAVSIGVGQEATLHIALAASRMARISGTVVDSQGRPAAGGFIMLRSGSAMGGMTTNGGQVGQDGTFIIPNVPPGEYTLDIRPTLRSPQALPEYASVPVTIANEDISNIRITTSRGATVRGRVVFEGTSPRTGGFGVLRVVARPADPDQVGPVSLPGAGRDGAVADDGSFELGGVIGEVTFRAFTPPTWTTKAVTLNGEDVLETPLRVRGTETITDLQVVLTDRLTEINGGVTDDRKRAVKDFVVMVLPAEPKPVGDGRFTRTARPDQQGRYTLRALPPGRYVIAALESLESGQEWNPQLQARVRDIGTAVTLAEGQTVTLDLKLTTGQ